MKVLSRVFRGKFVEALRRAYDGTSSISPAPPSTCASRREWHAFVDALFQTDWVVYAKPAFGGAPPSCGTSGAIPIAWRSAITG